MVNRISCIHVLLWYGNAVFLRKSETLHCLDENLNHSLILPNPKNLLSWPQANVLSKLSSHFLWQRLCSWFVVKVRLHWGQLHSVPVGCTLFSSSFQKISRCFNSSKTLSELNNIQCPCAVHTFLSLFQFNLTSHLLWVTCQGALSYFGAFDRRTMRAIISVCRVLPLKLCSNSRHSFHIQQDLPRARFDEARIHSILIHREGLELKESRIEIPADKRGLTVLNLIILCKWGYNVECAVGSSQWYHCCSPHILETNTTEQICIWQ